MPENELQHETSPYLLQHKDNPVHWMAWGDPAFARAKAENKPILLSVGYVACHWCHVMAHESFEDEEISAVMNDLVIDIKVDREERPDIDTIYQSALAMIGEQGNHIFDPGWLVGALNTAYISDVVSGIKAGDRVLLREGLAQNSGGQRNIQTNALRTKSTCSAAASSGKFPQTGIFEQIWRAWLRTDECLYHNAVFTSLNNVCQGGIYDHLGGGFARYSVDEMWLAPHFEKMLYDNAELIHLLTLIYQETKFPLYAQRIEETVAWLEREMIEEGSGFASTLDADSEGEETKFYVWNEAEVDALISEKSSDFTRVYNIDPAGNWDGKTILNRLHSIELLDDATAAEKAASRKVLLHARAHRIRPCKDTKVLADWNGLMVAALAFASHVFDRPKCVNWFSKHTILSARPCAPTVVCCTAGAPW